MNNNRTAGPVDKGLSSMQEEINDLTDDLLEETAGYEESSSEGSPDY